VIFPLLTGSIALLLVTGADLWLGSTTVTVIRRPFGAGTQSGGIGTTRVMPT
jgi:hypothetical protein